MKTIKKTVKPTSIFLAIILLLISTFNQSASAAMIGTDFFLEANCSQVTRHHLHHFISRAEIQTALAAWGLNTHEARARIDSLSDNEIKLISEQIGDLPAGGGLTGFILIVGAVILALIIVVEYTSHIKMYPQLKPSNY